MATIQIRDVPGETYDTIRRQAAAAGQSLQAYMRGQLIELIGSRTRKAEAIERIERHLAEHGGVGASAAEIVADVHADRRPDGAGSRSAVRRRSRFLSFSSRPAPATARPS